MYNSNVVYIKGYPLNQYENLCRQMQIKLEEMNSMANSQIVDLNDVEKTQLYLGYEVSADDLDLISTHIKTCIITQIHTNEILTFEDLVKVGVIAKEVKIQIKNQNVPLNLILDESQCLKNQLVGSDGFILFFNSSRDAFLAINKIHDAFQDNIQIQEDFFNVIFTNHQVSSLMDSDSQDSDKEEEEKHIPLKKRKSNNEINYAYPPLPANAGENEEVEQQYFSESKIIQNSQINYAYPPLPPPPKPQRIIYQSINMNTIPSIQSIQQQQQYSFSNTTQNNNSRNSLCETHIPETKSFKYENQYGSQKEKIVSQTFLDFSEQNLEPMNLNKNQSNSNQQITNKAKGEAHTDGHIYHSCIEIGEDEKLHEFNNKQSMDSPVHKKFRKAQSLYHIENKPTKKRKQEEVILDKLKDHKFNITLLINFLILFFYLTFPK